MRQRLEAKVKPLSCSVTETDYEEWTKQNKKQKLLETLCNVGMALSDPRCRQSLKLIMRSGQKEKEKSL